MSGSSEHFLNSFFNPRSVAIVGATRNPIKMNFQLTENLVRLGFAGKVYLVNPNTSEILGTKTYPSLRNIPDELDLVVSAVPFRATLGIVKECVERNVKRIVIVAGGFSEAGAEGEELHREVVRLTRESGIRVLGPNTLSPINTSNNLVISFHHVGKLNKGNLSFVFQSGMYEYKLYDFLAPFGICKLIDLGNKMDINEVDALEYLGQDPDTRVIAIHIESIRGNGRHFMEILSSTCKEKPVIILKSGRTPSGSKAAASHTGSIARENDLVFDGLLRQAGAIRAQNLEEFFDFAKAFEFLVPPSNNRVAVISLSGGEGVIATDACEQSGFRLAEVSEETRNRLKKLFPPWEIPVNPFDAGVSMQFHSMDINDSFSTLGSMLYDENVDCMIMQAPTLVFQRVSETLSQSVVLSFMDETVRVIVRAKEAGKPLALWRSTMDSIEDEFIRKLELQHIPVFESSLRAIRALSALLIQGGR
jgi:acyl-CoA synthetase (NDP forming)